MACPSAHLRWLVSAGTANNSRSASAPPRRNSDSRTISDEPCVRDQENRLGQTFSGSEFAQCHVLAVGLLEPFGKLNPRIHDAFITILRDHPSPGAFAKYCVIFFGDE